MGLKQETDLKISEEAAVWLMRLAEQDTPEVRAQFSTWLKQGAGHLEELLFAQAVWKELDGIDAAMRDRLWSAEDAGSIVDFPRRRALSLDDLDVRRERRPWAVATACIVATLVVGGIFLSVVDLGSNVYVTELGEQKAVKLGDGSVIHLNTSSRIEVRLTDKERVIRLTDGEALFTVEHDTHRPFYVLTDSARIRAVGTQFNVYRDSETQTRVAVVDGVVQVSSALPVAKSADAVQLKAGDEADVDTDKVIKTPAPNVERAVSWRTRRLMFPGNPVREIVRQFNRYNKTQIRIEGGEIQARMMSGVFDADDPEPLIEYLSRDPKVDIVRGDGEILIRSRQGFQRDR